jgi:hypothetical protein
MFVGGYRRFGGTYRLHLNHSQQAVEGTIGNFLSSFVLQVVCAAGVLHYYEFFLLLHYISREK